MPDISFQRGSRYVVEPPEAKDLHGLNDVVRGIHSCCDNRNPGPHHPACSKATDAQRVVPFTACCGASPGRLHSPSCARDLVPGPVFYEPPTAVPLLPAEPDKHCAICNGKAPKVPMRSFTRLGFALTPDPVGWMRVTFPMSSLKDMLEGALTAADRECQLICPPCAGEVAKFIAHRRQPMRTEYENLSE